MNTGDYNPPLDERMKRRLFNLAATVSLVLCLAMLMLWAEAIVLRSRRSLWIGGQPGGAYVEIRDDFFHASWGDLRPTAGPLRNGDFTDWAASGILVRALHRPSGSHHVWVSPTAAIAATALLPVSWFARRALLEWGRSRRSGACRRCGYDLRESPDRCPECGTRCSAELIFGPLVSDASAQTSQRLM